MATKQISFQVATESSVCMNVADVGWKWVPSSRSCNSEWAVSKV